MPKWWLWSLAAAMPGIAVLASLVFGTLYNLESLDPNLESAASMRSLRELYADPYLSHVTLFTLKQATFSTLASLVVGVLIALSLLCRVGKTRNLKTKNLKTRKLKTRNSDFLLDSLVLCFVLPPLVVVFGIVDLFGYNGVLNKITLALFSRRLFESLYGLGGIVVAHVFYNAPLVAYVCLQRLQAVGCVPLRLAADLRFSFPQTLRHVLLPCLKPALGGLAALVFILCLTSFTVVLMLGGGPRATTLPLAVFEAVRVDFDPARAAFLSLLQVLLSFVALFLLAPAAWQRLLPSARVASQSSPPTPHTMTHSMAQPMAQLAEQLLPRSVRFLGDLATLAILLLPLLVVGKGIMWGIVQGIAQQGVSQQNIFEGFAILTEAVFLDALLASLALGACSALVCCLVAVPLLWSVREGMFAKKNAVLPKILLTLAAYPLLALSPVVIATALFLLLHTTALYQAFPLPVVFLCLVAINGMLALPIVLRFFADAFFALARDSAHLWDDLRLSPWRRWRRIDKPAVAKSLKAGLACAFCFSLGDLSAVALFGRDELKTLPYLAYLLMGRYRWQEASVCVSVLVLLYFLVFRLFSQKFQGVTRQRGQNA